MHTFANTQELVDHLVVLKTTVSAESDKFFELDHGLQCAAELLPLPDQSQDAVVSVNNIQLWSDRSVGLDECVRVLVPGGALVVLLYTWAMPDAVPAEEWIAELTADLSTRGVVVESSLIRRFRSGPALVLAGRLA